MRALGLFKSFFFIFPFFSSISYAGHETQGAPFYLMTQEAEFLSRLVGKMKEGKSTVTSFDFERFLEVKTDNKVKYCKKSPELKVVKLSQISLDSKVSIYLGRASTVPFEDYKRLVYDILAVKEKTCYETRFYLFHQPSLPDILDNDLSTGDMSVREAMRAVGLEASYTNEPKPASKHFTFSEGFPIKTSLPDTHSIPDGILYLGQGFKITDEQRSFRLRHLNPFGASLADTLNENFSRLSLEKTLSLYFYLQEYYDQIEVAPLEGISKILKKQILKKLRYTQINLYSGFGDSYNETVQFQDSVIYPNSYPNFLQKLKEKKVITLLSATLQEVIAHVENGKVEKIEIKEERWSIPRASVLSGEIIDSFSKMIHSDTKVVFPLMNSTFPVSRWEDCKIENNGKIVYDNGFWKPKKKVSADDFYLFKTERNSRTHFYLIPRVSAKAILVHEPRAADDLDFKDETLGQVLESSGLKVSDEDKTRLAETFNKKFNELSIEKVFSLYFTLHKNWKEIDADVLKTVSTKLSRRILNIFPSIKSSLETSSWKDLYEQSIQLRSFLTQGDLNRYISYQKELKKVSQAMYWIYLRKSSETSSLFIENDVKKKVFLIDSARFERSFLKLRESLDKYSRSDITTQHKQLIVDVLKNDLEDSIGTVMSIERWLKKLGHAYQELLLRGGFEESEICELKYLLDASASAFLE